MNQLTAPRVAFALIFSLQAGCLAAVHGNVFPQWTMYFALGGTVIQAFLASIMGAPAPAADSKKTAT